MPSHTKRTIVSPATTPRQASFHFSSGNSPVGTPSVAKFGQIAIQETERHKATPTHPISAIRAPDPSAKPTSVSLKRLRPKTTSWSPSLARKLRWRLRQHTLWDLLVFVAFIASTVVFFSALTGAGYHPDGEQSVGWRAPPVRGVAPKASVPNFFDGFLRLVGLGQRVPTTDEQFDTWDEDSEPASHIRSTFANERAGHQLRRIGPWQKFRRLRRRGIVLSESSHRVKDRHTSRIELKPRASREQEEGLSTNGDKSEAEGGADSADVQRRGAKDTTLLGPSVSES